MHPPYREKSMTRPVLEMNTTPLIDVLLVLLVLLILTLPRMTHRVALDLPSGRGIRPSPPTLIEIDFDGRVFWNGAPIETDERLSRAFQQIALDPDAPPLEIHPDRHTRYERVAQVLATAQRARVTRIGLTPQSE
jgi:biopolymer transport protein ExbD